MKCNLPPPEAYCPRDYCEGSYYHYRPAGKQPCSCSYLTQDGKICWCCTYKGISCQCLCQCKNILKEFAETQLVTLQNKFKKFQSEDVGLLPIKEFKNLQSLQSLFEEQFEPLICPEKIDGILIGDSIGFALRLEDGWEIKTKDKNFKLTEQEVQLV